MVLLVSHRRITTIQKKTVNRGLACRLANHGAQNDHGKPRGAIDIAWSLAEGFRYKKTFASFKSFYFLFTSTAGDTMYLGSVHRHLRSSPAVSWTRTGRWLWAGWRTGSENRSRDSPCWSAPWCPPFWGADCLVKWRANPRPEDSAAVTVAAQELNPGEHAPRTKKAF